VRKCLLFIAKVTQILLHSSRKMQFWMLLQVIRIVSLGFKYLRQRYSSSLLSLPLLTCHERYSHLDDRRFGYIIHLRPHKTLVFQHHQISFTTIFLCVFLYLTGEKLNKLSNIESFFISYSNIFRS
jgi:hypothetical protein